MRLNDDGYPVTAHSESDGWPASYAPDDAPDEQAHVDPDAPLFVDDVPTKRVPMPSNRELMDELLQHAEYGTGETAPTTVPWPVRR